MVGALQTLSKPRIVPKKVSVRVVAERSRYQKQAQLLMAAIILLQVSSVDFLPGHRSRQVRRRLFGEARVGQRVW